MTTYYVSTAGLDANNGLGPDASHASNKPWLTAGKVFNAGSTVVPGDTVYFGPGTFYQGATLTLIAGISSAASPTAFRGDPTNAQGFKDGSGVRLSPAPSWITTRTSSEQDTAPASSAVLFTANTNGTSGVQLYDLVLECAPTAGSVIQLAVTTTLCRSWLVQDCRLVGATGITLSSGISTAALNLTVRRCLFMTESALLSTNASAASTADADLNVQFEHCLIFGGATGPLALSASGGNLAGGIDFVGCTVMGLTRGTGGVFGSVALRMSTVTPCTITGCKIYGGAPVVANTSGQWTSGGFNRIYGTQASTNFTLAGSDIAGHMPHDILPDLVKWGLILPQAEVFGWSTEAAAAQKHSAWTNTQADYRGRTVRPWGSGASIGCWETPELTQDTSGAITGGGANSLKVTGAGEFSFLVPVDARSATISVKTKSTSYGGTNYPQLIAEASPGIGVTQQTGTATDATEQTVSITVTATAKGVVELRLISRSSSTSSVTYFDNVSA